MKGTPSQNQLGFDELLKEAEGDNVRRQQERQTAHLPGTMVEGLPFFRSLLGKHQAAMLAGDEEETMRLRDEADLLALKLNGLESGILAGPDAAGCILERETAAVSGEMPIWGQEGEFIVSVGSMRVKIELDGVFGIEAAFPHDRDFRPMPWFGNARSLAKPATGAFSAFTGPPRKD